MSETATETKPAETMADGARGIFDALTIKARENETAAARNVAARRSEQEAQDAAKKERIRDNKGRFSIEVPMKAAPKAKVEAPKPPEPKTELPKVETNDKGRTEEPEADADVTADSKEKALTALRRAKVPKGVIDGMKPKDWTSWGLELAEIQSNTDRLTKEHRELKKQAEDRAKEPKQETRTETATAETVSTDLAAAVKAFDDAGPEFGKALRDALTIQSKIADAKLGERDKLIKELSDTINSIRLDGLAAAARTELRDRFPQLRTKDGFQRAMARAERFAADKEAYEKFTDPLERMTEVLTDACHAEFKGDMAAQELSDAKETDRKRLGGQLTAPSGSSRATTESPKGQDRAEKIYWAMVDGLSKEDAVARVDGLR